jgi:hypothetical protein
MACRDHRYASAASGSPAQKNRRGHMAPVSAIKLIRTDTTLDLSQKAEKGMTGLHVASEYVGSCPHVVQMISSVN